MKFRLLDLLICPNCRHTLQCDVYHKSIITNIKERKTYEKPLCKFWCWFKNVSPLGNEKHSCRDCLTVEIIEGVLKCSCGKSYPIVDGIPRILPSSLEPVEKRTAKKFGYEWTKFSDYEVDNFAIFMKFLEPNFFYGKTGLDVGCGAGRHLIRISDLGGEVIGFDLSNAVNIAYQRTFRLPSVHVIQCNIYYLPFRESAFDFVSSLGVLHHLPDPKKGFTGLIPFLRPESGTIFFLVYQKSLRKIFLDPIRRVTTHLPENIIYWISLIAAIFDYGVVCQTYRLLKKVPFIGEVIDLVTPARVKEYSQYTFKVSLTDWFDRLSAPISHFYNPEEIKKWLKEKSLADIKISTINSSWVYGYGVRKNT